jgi:hypothetical protein
MAGTAVSSTSATSLSSTNGGGAKAAVGEAGGVPELTVSDTNGNAFFAQVNQENNGAYFLNTLFADNINSNGGLYSNYNTEDDINGNAGDGTLNLDTGLPDVNLGPGSIMVSGSEYIQDQLAVDGNTLITGSLTLTGGGTVSSGTLSGNIVATSISSGSESAVLNSGSSNSLFYLTPGPPTVVYGDGASVTRGYEDGGSTLPNGGLSGNYIDLVAKALHATQFNDGYDGATSQQMLGRYTTGNSNFGVTVPSPHAVATSGSFSRRIAIIESCAFNDSLNSITTGSSIAYLAAETGSLHADKYFVVMLTSPNIPASFTNSPTGTPSEVAAVLAVNQAIMSGSTGADLPLDSHNWLPNQLDTSQYNASDHIHFNATGHQTFARSLIPAIVAGGAVRMNNSYGYTSEPEVLLDGLTVDGYNGASLNVNTSINMGSGQGYFDVYNGPGSPNAILGLYAAVGDSFEQYTDSQADANFKWGSMLSPTSRVFTTWATMTGGTTSLSGTFTSNTVAATTGSISSIASTSGTVSGVETIGGLLTLNNGLTFGSNNQPLYIYSSAGYIVGAAAVAGNSFLIFGGSNSASTIDLGISTNGSTLSTTYLALSSTGATFPVNGTISTPGVIVDSGETINGNASITGTFTNIFTYNGTMSSGTTAAITNSSIYLHHITITETNSGAITNQGNLSVTVSGSTATVKSSSVLDSQTFTLIATPW